MNGQFQQLLKQNTPLFNACFGFLAALLVCAFYITGTLQPVDDALQDNWYRLRLQSPKPHSDIILIGIDDKTVGKLGWPISRDHYTRLIQELHKQKVKAIGFNLLIGNWNDRKIDQELIRVVKEAGNVVMPVFYDYANQNILAPMSELQNVVAALGNVAVYPGAVARHIELESLNRNTHPRQIYFPMGVELARLYFDIPAKDVGIHHSTLELKPHVTFPMEKNGLIRISYQGAPGYFKKVAFEDVLAAPSQFNFKNKVVFVGAMAPTLSDVTTSPYADAASNPMFGTEVQAHLVQSLLSQAPVFHLSEPWILFCIVLLGSSLPTILFRSRMSRQLLVLSSVVLSLVILSFLLFNLFSLQMDIIPMFVVCGLVGVILMGLSTIRSTLLLNDEISSLQTLETSMLQSTSSYEKMIENALTTLIYVSQADWVTFRKYLPEEKKFTLIQAQGKQHQDLTESLPATYSSSFLSKYNWAVKVSASEWNTLPTVLKEAYPQERGHFFLLPLRYSNQEMFGLVELYYASFQELGDSDNMEDLLGSLRDSMSKSLCSKSVDEGSALGLTRRVEEKIYSMSRLNRAIRDDMAFLETVLKTNNNPIVVCHPLGEIITYNEKFRNLLSLEMDRERIAENIMPLMESIFHLEPRQWQEPWFYALHKGKMREIVVSAFIQETNRTYKLSFTPVTVEYIVRGVLLLLMDVTDLHQQANYDKLTGLRNRRYFDDLLLKEFQRCQRNPNPPVSLLLLDIDHFKSFNDAYGHQIGDDVLVEFGKVLMKTVRKTDFACRYGGEEMAVILPATYLKGAAIAAEKIRRTIEDIELFDPTGQPIRRITASIGVAEYDPGDVSPEEVIRRADDALYKCKEAGRNCIHMYPIRDEIQKFEPGLDMPSEFTVEV